MTDEELQLGTGLSFHRLEMDPEVEAKEQARYEAERAEDRDSGQRIAALDMALRYCADGAPDADHVVSVAETFHRFLAGIPAPTHAPTSN